MNLELIGIFVTVSASIYAVMEAIKAGFPEFTEKPLLKKLKPIAPVVIGAAIMPFALDGYVESVQYRIALGILGGHSSSWMYSVWRSVVKKKANEALGGKTNGVLEDPSEELLLEDEVPTEEPTEN
jgi:hypothetical protein